MRFDERKNMVLLSRQRNSITCRGVRYRLDFLTAARKPLAGGNGVVYKASTSQGDEFAIKICRFGYDDDVNDYVQKRLDRFEREIEALSLAESEGLQNIVQLIGDGEVSLNGKSFRYFIMEKCDETLSEYLSNNEDISTSQKLLLYKQIVAGIHQLNSFSIYHRDIKSENILFKDGFIRVGDLGLVDNRNTDFIIDEIGEKIGPFGWLSPEAANKFLVEKTENRFGHSCIIDSKSDVFQLGKLGWYIFNGNLPVGQITQDDFIVGDKEIFDLLFNSLQYDIDRRLSIETLVERLEDLSFQRGI